MPVTDPAADRECPAWVTIDGDRRVHCNKGAEHEVPAVHHGRVRVTLPEGHEKAASLVWDGERHPWDENGLERAT